MYFVMLLTGFSSLAPCSNQGPPSDEWMLKPLADLDSVEPKTDQSSQESEESVNKPKYSIADCAAKLAELPGITIGDPFYVFAIDHLRINHARRLFFMEIPNDKHSLSYLNYVRDRKSMPYEKDTCFL